jgi:hypothetical protein
MTRRLGNVLLAAVVAFCTGCHPGPVLNTGKSQSVGGTIAGIVSASGGTAPLVSRKVTAVEVTTGARYDATTAANGGYTIKVPTGTYRIEVEVREGETFEKKPGETRVDNGDLDAGRDFVITLKPR